MGFNPFEIRRTTRWEYPTPEGRGENRADQPVVLGEHWWDVARQELLKVLAEPGNTFPKTRQAWQEAVPRLLGNQRLRESIRADAFLTKQANDKQPGMIVWQEFVVEPEDLAQLNTADEQRRAIENELAHTLQSGLGSFISQIKVEQVGSQWVVKVGLDAINLKTELYTPWVGRKLVALSPETKTIIGRDLKELDHNQVGLDFVGLMGLSRKHLQVWTETTHSDAGDSLTEIVAQDLGSSNGSYLISANEDDAQSLDHLHKKVGQGGLIERRLADGYQRPGEPTVLKKGQAVCLIGPHIQSSPPIVAYFYLRRGRLIMDYHYVPEDSDSNSQRGLRSSGADNPPPPLKNWFS